MLSNKRIAAAQQRQTPAAQTRPADGMGNRMGAAANAANAAKQQGMAAMAATGISRKPPTQANPFGMGMSQNTAAMNKISQAKAQTRPAGLGSAMSGPKTGLGTATNMKTMAGMGAALGKKLGMKSGGAVGSASKRADGIASKGKTKGRVC